MKSSRKTNRRSASKGITGSNKKNAADTGLSPSKRHREKLNTVMDELCDLLPLSREVKTNLDRLSVLKLTVSFFQTQNLMISSTDRSRQCKPTSSKEEQTRLAAGGINLSELALSAIGGFFVVLTEDGVVYYISENVQFYLGYSQTRLMHQEFFPHVHPDDLHGLKFCFDNLKNLSDKNDTINTLGAHQQCFCNIKCHAGRLSSHVSPFYYKCFKFYGRLKPVKSKSVHGGTKYGFFALCSPVDRQAEVFRPLSNNAQKYTCKMDAAFQNLEVDTRGLKHLLLGEKDLMGRSSYCFFHPEDSSGMALVHERLLHENKGNMTFRVLKGNGNWQWVRGRAYSLISNGKVLGMVSKNVFVSDEEGEYFKEQDMKDIQEWKARRSLALPFSQGTPSYEPPSPSSGSMSPGTERFHSIPIGPPPIPPCQAMEATPVPDDLSRQYAYPLPQPHKPKAMSSCLVNDEPMPLNDVVMDNDTMLKIIKDLQSSLIDGANSRSCQYPTHPVPEGDLFAGSAFIDSLQERNTDLPFIDQCTNIMKANGQHIGFGNTTQHDIPFSDVSTRHIDSSGLNVFHENTSFHNKPDNTFRVSEMKGLDEEVHMDEHAFVNFVPLPLVEVENILSNDKSTYTMTSPYELPPLQPMVMTDMSPAYHGTNTYHFNEQKPGPMGGGYGLTNPSTGISQGLRSTNRLDNNGCTPCSELTHPGSHKFT